MLQAQKREDNGGLQMALQSALSELASQKGEKSALVEKLVELLRESMGLALELHDSHVKQPKDFARLACLIQKRMRGDAGMAETASGFADEVAQLTLDVSSELQRTEKTHADQKGRLQENI